jgi:hypothetical protein
MSSSKIDLLVECPNGNAFKRSYDISIVDTLDKLKLELYLDEKIQYDTCSQSLTVKSQNESIAIQLVNSDDICHVTNKCTLIIVPKKMLVYPFNCK